MCLYIVIDFNLRRNIICVPGSKRDFSLFHPIFVPKWKTCCSPPVLLFQEIFNFWLREFIFTLVLKIGRKSKKHPCKYFCSRKKNPLPQNGPAWLVSIIQVWICVNEVLLFIQYNSNEPKVSNPNKWTCFQNHFECSWSAAWWFFNIKSKILQYCLHEIELLLLIQRWKVKMTLNCKETAEKNIVFKK